MWHFCSRMTSVWEHPLSAVPEESSSLQFSGSNYGCIQPVMGIIFILFLLCVCLCLSDYLSACLPVCLSMAWRCLFLWWQVVKGGEKAKKLGKTKGRGGDEETWGQKISWASLSFLTIKSIECKSQVRHELQSTSCFNVSKWNTDGKATIMGIFIGGGTSSYHMSSSEEYSVAPSKASGGRYHSVTTSEEYVWLGMDLARARPVQRG